LPKSTNGAQSRRYSFGPHKLLKGEFGQLAATAVEFERTSVVKAEMSVPHNFHSQARFEGGAPRKDEAVVGFVKNMTHELRTPLNVIIGLCQYLERDRKTPLNEQQKDTVERMERNAHALLESVNHLLECVRSGKYE